MKVSVAFESGDVFVQEFDEDGAPTKGVCPAEGDKEKCIAALRSSVSFLETSTRNCKDSDVVFDIGRTAAEVNNDVPVS